MIAALVHELLKAESFATSDDLTEAVKSRCAKLRIPYDSATVWAAVDAVARTRPVPVAQAVLTSSPPADDFAPISRAEASRILATIHARLALPAIKTMVAVDRTVFES